MKTKALLTSNIFFILAFTLHSTAIRTFPQHTFVLLLSSHTSVFPMKLYYFLICNQKIAIMLCALPDCEKRFTCVVSLIFVFFVKPFGFFMELNDICVRVYLCSPICHSLDILELFDSLIFICKIKFQNVSFRALSSQSSMQHHASVICFKPALLKYLCSVHMPFE